MTIMLEPNNPILRLYYDFGCSLIPITPGTKIPAVPSWTKNQEEQCDEFTFQRWQRSFDSYAVITGPVSGLVVVDMDSPEALAWAEKYLPPTPWVVLTGIKNGFRGQHWYYLWPSELAPGTKIRNRARVKYNGGILAMDIRGEGGYVLAPGSPHMDGGYYEWTAEWTPSDDVPTFDPAWFPEVQQTAPSHSIQPLAGDLREMQNRFTRWIDQRPPPLPGNRNHEVFTVACSGYDYGLPGDVVLEMVWEWNNRSPEPLGYQEVEKTVRSAGRSKSAPMFPKGQIESRESRLQRVYSDLEAEQSLRIARERQEEQQLAAALDDASLDVPEDPQMTIPEEEWPVQETEWQGGYEDDYYANIPPMDDDPATPRDPIGPDSYKPGTHFTQKHPEDVTYDEMHWNDGAGYSGEDPGPFPYEGDPDSKWPRNQDPPQENDHTEYETRANDDNPSGPAPGDTDHRVTVERNFISTALHDVQIAHLVATFSPEEFQDQPSRSVLEALKRITKEHQELSPMAIGLECQRDKKWADWQVIFAHWERYIKGTKPTPKKAYEAMREACDWDLAEKFLMKAFETRRSGSFKDWISDQNESIQALMASAQTVHEKTLEEHVREWLDDHAEGRVSRGVIHLKLISDNTGLVGGGDVIPIVGPPKTGKSSIAMAIVTDAAKQTIPIKSLVGQLEMRMEQVAKREVAKILKRPPHEISKEEARALHDGKSKIGNTKFLRHIRMTSRCTTLKSYRAEVSQMLSQHRDIKLWVTDYAECIQKFGENANRTDESEAIAKMIKEVAIAFDVVAILLIQPTKLYSQEGHLGPRTYHAKNSGKWEQDAQAMLFLHSPNRFYSDIDKEYLELHVLCGRDCPKSVIKLNWTPELFSYEPWEGDTPTTAMNTPDGHSDFNAGNFKPNSQGGASGVQTDLPFKPNKTRQKKQQ